MLTREELRSPDPADSLQLEALVWPDVQAPVDVPTVDPDCRSRVLRSDRPIPAVRPGGEGDGRGSARQNSRRRRPPPLRASGAGGKPLQIGNGAYRDRTGDLRLAKLGWAFAPVRTRSLYPPGYRGCATAYRTRPNRNERSVLPLFPLRLDVKFRRRSGRRRYLGRTRRASAPVCHPM
jgi:hypothetical protein